MGASPSVHERAFAAARKGNLEGLQGELKGVEDPNSVKDHDNYTLYYVAALGNHTRIMKWLFSLGGCNPNVQDNVAWTPGMYSMDSSNLHAFLLWLHHGGNPAIAGKYGRSALYEGYARNDLTKAVSRALRSCRNCDLVLEVLRSGRVPTIHGVSQTAVAAVKRFLDSGIQDVVGEPALVAFVVALTGAYSPASTAGALQEETTVANLHRRLRDSTAQLKKDRAAAVASDAQHKAAVEELLAQHSDELRDTHDAHAAVVNSLQAEVAAARDKAAALEGMQQQLADLQHHLTDTASQLKTVTSDAAALSAAVKGVSIMMSSREPWPSGITADAVADVAAGLSSPTTSPSATLLLHGLHTHSPDAVLSAIAVHADAACAALVAMCQPGGEGGAVCREAGLLAWLVAEAHAAAPGPHWPSMTRVIGSLHGVFRGMVEHDDAEETVLRAAMGSMSCDLGRVLGSHALHTLLDMHPEDKYRLVGHLTEDDVMVRGAGHVFYAGGRRDALTEWAALCEAEFNGEELIVVHPETDKVLSEIMTAAVSAVGSIADVMERATALAVFVQGRLGGSPESYEDFVEACKDNVAGVCMGSRRLQLGELTLGVCRHRAILYKLLADQAGIGISCRLVRGDLLLGDRKTRAPHAWNVVSIETGTDDGGDVGKTHEYYVVDLMRSATLVVADSGVGEEYRRSGGGTYGGATLFGGRANLTAEEVASLPVSAEIASGAFGIVYSAGSKQAVKRVPLSSRFPVEYAMREVKVMSVLRHPYLMPLKQHFVSETHVAMVMPLGAGPLSKVREVAPGVELAPLLLQVALGMEHLHGRRRVIVHRDLKPSNIVLFKNLDGSVVARIGDFGSAKVSRHGTSVSDHTRVCTPGYAAPEQRWDRGWEAYSGVSVSPASDVYAFGQVMGRMYVGVGPSTMPPPRHQYEDGVLVDCGMPQPLKSLYLWCTAANAQDRPTFEDVVVVLAREVQAGLARKALGL